MVKKTNFFAMLALLALQRLRVHSDLLDGTALSLVVCAKGPMNKKV